MGEILEFIIYIFFLVLIIIGAYYAAKWVSARSMSLYKGKHVSIIERIPIDRDKAFILLKKGEKVYLIGITGSGMTVIDCFDYEELAAGDIAMEEKRTALNIMAPAEKIMDSLAGFFKGKKFKIPGIRRKMEDISGNAVESKSDREFDEILKRVDMRKKHLAEQGEILKRGGK